MGKDIRRILEGWDFSVGSPLVRRIIGDDGREKIQRRIELGVLQFAVEGRPDGERPHGFPSLLDYYKRQAGKKEGADRPNGPFQLSSSDCASLQMEALLYYQRRLCYFELHDYEGAARDARRNLDLLAFVREYAGNEEDQLAMDQYRAFVTFHRAKAEVLGCLDERKYGLALKHIEQAEAEIRGFYEEYGRDELFETSDEISQFNQWKKQIEGLRPLSRREALERQLKEAVEREEYERAAKIRDEIHEKSVEEDAK